jgi:hypothetical protein
MSDVAMALRLAWNSEQSEGLATRPRFADSWRSRSPSSRDAPALGCRLPRRSTLHPFRNRRKVPGDPSILRRRHERCPNGLLDDRRGAVELACESAHLWMLRRASVFRRGNVGELQQCVTKSVSGTGQLLKVLCLFPLENHG